MHGKTDAGRFRGRGDGCDEALEVVPHLLARDRRFVVRHGLGGDVAQAKAAGASAAAGRRVEGGADDHRVLADLRHEIVGDHLDAEPAEMADDALVALGLLGGAFLAEHDPVDRRPRLGNLPRQAETRIAVADRRWSSSRSSGRSCMS